VQPETEKLYGGNSTLFPHSIAVVSSASVTQYERFNPIDKDEFVVLHPGLETYVRDELRSIFKKVEIEDQNQQHADYDCWVMIEFRESSIGYAASVTDVWLTLAFEGCDKSYTAGSRVDYSMSGKEATYVMMSGSIILAPVGLPKLRQATREKMLHGLEQAIILAMKNIKEQILMDSEHFAKLNFK